MRDQLLSLAGARFSLVAQSADIGDGIRLIPAPTRRKPSKPIGWPTRSLAQDDRVVRDLDVEPVAGFDP